MSEASRESFETEKWIDAPPETLWEYFTDPAKMVRWHGAEAELDPRPGGTWRCSFPDGSVARGEFVELDRPNFLAYTWGFEEFAEKQVYGWENTNSTPPGGSRVEVTLTPSRGGTLLSIRHFGFQPNEPVRDGWGYFLGMLGELLGPGRGTAG